MGDSKSHASLNPRTPPKPSTASQIRPLRPVAFGRYELLGRLRLGGMAELYRARERDGDGRIVAIKRILPSFTDEADYLAMFADEARLALRLKHPGIVEALEIGEVEGELYIAFEYVHGNDVGALLRRAREQKRPLPTKVACRIALEVCAALGYAHELCDETGKPLAIVHRDVSPQNVLISYDGDVKLIDFGIAKSTDQLMRTQAGLLKGKHGYLSPEQACGYALDHRSDLFSLAICLYEMLTAERLFQGASDFSTLARVRRAEVLPIRERNPNVPEGLATIVHRALAPEPGLRFESAQAMGRALARFAKASGEHCDRTELAQLLRETFPNGIDPSADTLTEFARDPSTGLFDAFDDLEPPSAVSSLIEPEPAAAASSHVLRVHELNPIEEPLRERSYHEDLFEHDEPTRVVDYQSTASGEIADESTQVAPAPRSDATRPQRCRPAALQPRSVPETQLDWDEAEDELSTHVYDDPPTFEPPRGLRSEPVFAARAHVQAQPDSLRPRSASRPVPIMVAGTAPAASSLRPQRSTNPGRRVSTSPSLVAASRETKPLSAIAGRALVGVVLALVGASLGFYGTRDPEPSRLQLTIAPADASVRLDAVEIAHASGAFLVANIAPNAVHRIEVSKDGFRSWGTQLLLRPGQELSLPPIDLVREASAAAARPRETPTVAPEQGDDTLQPSATSPEPPPTTLSSPHPRSVRSKAAARPAHAAPKPAHAVSPRPTAPAAPSAGTATLRVNSRPWSRVYVDGRLIGSTPQMGLVLRAGTHTVTLVNPDFNLRKVLSVQLRPGETATKIVALDQ